MLKFLPVIIFLVASIANARQSCDRTHFIINWTEAFAPGPEKLLNNLNRNVFKSAATSVRLESTDTASENKKHILKLKVGTLHGEIDLSPDVRTEYSLFESSIDRSGLRLNYSVFISEKRPELKGQGINSFFISEVLKGHRISEIETTLVRDNASIFYRDLLGAESLEGGFSEILKEAKLVQDFPASKAELRNQIIDSLINGTPAGRLASRYGFIYPSKIVIDRRSINYVAVRSRSTETLPTEIQIVASENEIIDLN